MASISSVITGGFGVPGSAFLVITDGFGTAGVAPPAPDAFVQPALGNTKWDRNRKKKHRVIRFSDFETREALAAELAAAALPIVSIPLETTIDEWEEIEDDFIAFELMRLLS